MRQKRSKTWDMRWNWLRQKQMSKVFKIIWEKGSKNKADYFSKHHSPKHHREKRSDYILKGFLLQEYVDKYVRNKISQGKGVLISG